MDLAVAIRRRAVSVLEVVDAHLERIARLNPTINAIVTLDEESARRRAEEADDALARGEIWGPLHGIPITLKDGHATAGLRTTAGHPALAQHVPASDGSIAKRLKRAGAILLGKTNVSPLLMDIQADNPIFGRTRNPWNLERTSGGSSGGAAAAVAAHLTVLDVGSDYAGSIRIPAHFCGVFGLKATENRVPIAGHIPEPLAAARAPSFWSPGPLARSVGDLALALRVIAGADPSQPEVPPIPAPEMPEVEPVNLRLAWAPTFPGVPASSSIVAAVRGIAATLGNLGARVDERLPDVSWEEMANVRSRIIKALDTGDARQGAASVPLGEYFEALERRSGIISIWERWFESVDALLCPVAMVTAFPHCRMNTPIPVDRDMESYWKIIGHCAPFNLTGHPSVVVPIGRDPKGLPIGAQLVGKRWGEGRLLGVAALLARVAGPIGAPPLN